MNWDIISGRYIWNAEKERLNIKRHGVSFAVAAQAFEDPRRLISCDELHSAKEERFFCVGRVGLRIATVRFTYRGKLIRIFGAAYWRKGQRLYEKAKTHR